MDDGDVLVGRTGSDRFEEMNGIGLGSRLVGGLERQIAELSGGGQDASHRRKDLQLVGVIAGDIGVGANDPADGEWNPCAFDCGRHDFSAETAGAVVLMHDDEFPGLADTGENGLLIPWTDGTKVDQVHGDAGPGEDFGRLAAERNGGPPRDEGEIGP